MLTARDFPPENTPATATCPPAPALDRRDVRPRAGARPQCPHARPPCPRARPRCPRARPPCPRARPPCPRARTARPLASHYDIVYSDSVISENELHVAGRRDAARHDTEP